MGRLSRWLMDERCVRRCFFSVEKCIVCHTPNDRKCGDVGNGFIEMETGCSVQENVGVLPTMSDHMRFCSDRRRTMHARWLRSGVRSRFVAGSRMVTLK